MVARLQFRYMMQMLGLSKKKYLTSLFIWIHYNNDNNDHIGDDEDGCHGDGDGDDDDHYSNQ